MQFTTIQKPVCDNCRKVHPKPISTGDPGHIFFRRDATYPIWVCSVECQRKLEDKYDIKFAG